MSSISMLRPGDITDRAGHIHTEADRLALCEEISTHPIFSKANDIRHGLRQSPVIMTIAATGSGKSTGLPLILRGMPSPAGPARFVMTQPRIMAAVGVSTRVSDVLLAHTGDDRYTLGHHVQYRTGRESLSLMGGAEFLFVTEGLALMRLLYSGNVPPYIILDELHEKTNHMIVLLACLRRLLARNNQSCKLILSSATIDPTEFQDYFRPILGGDFPVIEAEGRTFPVTRSLVDPREYMSTIIAEASAEKNILVFAEGKREIEAVRGALFSIFPNKTILALHADLSIEEQQKILRLQPTPGEGVIIVATNIAQTSITLPYIDVVVSNGRMKTLWTNDLGLNELRTVDLDANGRKQQAGRCGRTHPGEAFLAHDVPDEALKASGAEIEHTRIDRLILLMLSAKYDLRKMIRKGQDGGSVMRERFGIKFLHTPNLKLIDIAYKDLERLGAIDQHGNITELGLEMLKYPLEPDVSRMLIEGVRRDCTDTIVKIAAMRSVRGTFMSKKDIWKDIGFKKDYSSDYEAWVELFDLVTLRYIDAGTPRATYERLERIQQLLKSSYEGGDNVEYARKVDQAFRRFSMQTADACPYQLFELVDMTDVGIKNQRLYEILSTLEIIHQRIDDNVASDQQSNDVAEANVPKNARTGSTVYQRAGQDLSPRDNMLACILTGAGGKLYRYDDTIKKIVRPDFPEGFGLDLALTSVVRPSKFGFYVGTPLIIGSMDDPEFTAVLTGATRIAERDIDKVGAEWIEYDTLELVLPDDNPKRRLSGRRHAQAVSDKVVARVRRAIGGTMISDIVHALDRETSVDEIARKWLPDFLIDHNQVFQRWIRETEKATWDAHSSYQDKDGHYAVHGSHGVGGRPITVRRRIDRMRFIEALRQITIHHRHKIERLNPTQIVSTFTYDTQVLQDLMASNDSTVIEFLSDPFVPVELPKDARAKKAKRYQRDKSPEPLKIVKTLS